MATVNERQLWLKKKPTQQEALTVCADTFKPLAPNDHCFLQHTKLCDSWYKGNQEMQMILARNRMDSRKVLYVMVLFLFFHLMARCSQFYSITEYARSIGWAEEEEKMTGSEIRNWKNDPKIVDACKIEVTDFGMSPPGNITILSN